jgi:hypothetical protein
MGGFEPIDFGDKKLTNTFEYQLPSEIKATANIIF